MSVEEVIEKAQEFGIEVNSLNCNIKGPEAYKFLYLNSELMLIVITMSNRLNFELAAIIDKRCETEEPFISLLWPVDQPIDSEDLSCQIGDFNALDNVIGEHELIKMLTLLRRMLS